MFELELAWDRPAQTPSQAAAHVLRVHLTPQVNAVSSEGLPLRVALALDVSSSMAGEKLERAREACLAVLAQLRPEDTLSLATFGSAVEPLLTQVPGEMAAREQVEAALARMQAFGVTRTDLALNWLQAALPAESGVLRVAILITDGHATDPRGAALPDVSSLIAQAAEQGESGVTLCTVGLGDAANFNTAFLVDLSDRGHGAFLYADTPEALEPQLRARLCASQAMATNGARLILRPLLPGVTITACCRFRPELLPLDAPPAGKEMVLPLGALRADTPTDVLLTLQVPPLSQGEPLGTVDVLEVWLDVPALTPQKAYGEGEGEKTSPPPPLLSKERGTATAAITFTNSYAEAQKVNADVDTDRLNWDLATYSEALQRTDDPRRTSQLLSDIQFFAQKTGRLDVAGQAVRQLEELQKTGKWNRHRATGLLTSTRRPEETA